MSKQEKKALVPLLRFPEFEGMPEWEIKQFEKVFNRITTKNAENNPNVLTISAQQGLVSQLDYFNKSVAAKDVTGYYLVHKGDFAYNKSYSKGYPMGAIKPLKDYEKGVVSTLYICFRAKDNFNASFFEQYFDAGILNSEIEQIAQEGGRNHGLLNVSVTEFFKDIALHVPLPDEQQKIADCLASLDDLITAQTQKRDALKAHKKGLMQQLFPAEGEILPKLRFPEFRDKGEWGTEELDGKTKKVGSGITPKGGDQNYKKEGRHFVRSQNIGWGCLILDDVAYIDEETHSSFLATEIQKGDVLLNITGASIGRSAIANQLIEGGNVNQHVCIIRTKQKELNPVFLNQFLLSQAGQSQIDGFQAGGNRQGLNFAQIRSFSIPMPSKIEEQQKIADCLTSIDDLITAQTQKIESLKAHKKGLMQQLFPVMDEVEA